MEQETIIELVKQAQAGDSVSMERLLTYAHTPVSYQCRKFMSTAEDAEELKELRVDALTKVQRSLNH